VFLAELVKFGLGEPSLVNVCLRSSITGGSQFGSQQVGFLLFREAFSIEQH
jgi:hypothetical protein